VNFAPAAELWGCVCLITLSIRDCSVRWIYHTRLC